MFEIMLAFSLAAAPAAPEPPRPRDPENYEPWMAEQQIRPGDRWARVRLDLDSRGRVLRCRVAASNERNSERRFWMCNAFMGGAFQTAPVMRDGVAVPGTVERFVVLPGRNSRDIYERERRRERARQRGERASAGQQ